MINILLDLVNEKDFNSRIVKKIREELPDARISMILGTPEELPIFEQLGECILRDNTARGIYEEQQLDMEHCVPIDDELLQYMNQYSLEILYQQRRFEGYPNFSIDPALESHYTVYMHNLFFWYNYLKRKQITHVFISTVPHEGYDCMIYYLCKYLDIPVQMINVSIIQSRRYPFKDICCPDTAFVREYEKLQEQYRDVPVEDIPLEESTRVLYEGWSSLEPDRMKPWYMKVNPFTRRLRTRCGEFNIIRVWRGLLGSDYVQYGLGIRFWGAAFRKIPQMIKKIPNTYRRWRIAEPVRKSSISLNNYYNSLAVEPVKGERYIYFPLHFQPEATSNPMGGGLYADQMLPLNILSKALPDDIKIYVKTHPEQLSLMRTREYYKDMVKIPRVRLIKQEASTYELMKNALAVATLTGTAMWECQFYGIPALVFGYSLKNLAPLSYPVRTVEECRQAVKLIMENPSRDALKELKIYTKAMYNQSFAFADLEKVLPMLIVNFVQGKENVLEGIDR